MRFEGKKAVVTGSGGLMGGTIAFRLAQEGADVVLNDRVAERTDAWEQKIKALGRDVVTVVGNVTKREDAARFVGAALDRWGQVDLLVNAAGGFRGPNHNPIWEMSEEDWEITMGNNMRGVFHCTQLVLPSMMERRTGKIVNIASTSWAGEGYLSHYSSSKAAVVAFTRSCAFQLAEYNINVNAIAPGYTRSAVQAPGAFDRFDTTRVPLGRANEPDDIADAALFLLSEQARNISGQLITVAGGSNPSL
jgi:NAD(P)-dependent dehydrogenase (short-subunit alcohol dehydrogenase family)